MFGRWLACRVPGSGLTQSDVLTSKHICGGHLRGAMPMKISDAVEVVEAHGQDAANDKLAEG